MERQYRHDFTIHYTSRGKADRVTFTVSAQDSRGFYHHQLRNRLMKDVGSPPGWYFYENDAALSTTHTPDGTSWSSFINLSDLLDRIQVEMEKAQLYVTNLIDEALRLEQMVKAIQPKEKS